ncbi:MAG: formylglycine-generating enzyme family protein, partial [Gammaproteobacteria bacterium]|nr:formylglycine-generating enzyme family protein [Gammaproteobacteria bacterium]
AANKILTTVATTYEEMLKNAYLALLALNEASISKKDCASLEKAINKQFCSMANTQYGVTLAVFKRGEYGDAKTQFEELVAEYKRLFITNGQSRVSVAGLSVTLQTMPAGSFKMGTGEDGDKKIVRDVKLPTYKIMAKEVTFALYDAYAKSVGKKKPYDDGWGRNDYPVINVSWNDARGFARWLSRKTDKKFRLPTEAEWEYAAMSSRATKYSWGNEISCDMARFNGGRNSACFYKPDGIFKGTVPVGSYSPSPWGLYDMSGNVWEWTQDCADENYHDVPGNVRIGDGRCSKRVVRGGSWSSLAEGLSLVSYDWNNPDMQTHVDGFRLVQEL